MGVVYDRVGKIGDCMLHINEEQEFTIKVLNQVVGFTWPERANFVLLLQDEAIFSVHFPIMGTPQSLAPYFKTELVVSVGEVHPIPSKSIVSKEQFHKFNKIHEEQETTKETIEELRDRLVGLIAAYEEVLTQLIEEKGGTFIGVQRELKSNTHLNDTKEFLLTKFGFTLD